VVFLEDKSKLPEELVRSVELWAGCVSGAMEKREYEALLSGAGFEEVSVEVTNVYDPARVTEDPKEMEALRRVPAASAFVRARKPGGR
jgi:hypothetical protein